MSKQSYVYMMTNKSNKVIYTGVTADLKKRVYQHKNGMGGIFTNKYNINKLVYFQLFEDITTAISEEKRIKSGSRKKKIHLIESMNPDWSDLNEDL